MPIPRHSAELPNVQVPPAADCGGVTELRVHGVGGTRPDAILGDLAPEQASGDAIAGFYRSCDHRARDEALDVDRHVEAYSWGGLTSQSKVRVLWLALLPFLLGNLAGWMCSARTRGSAWRFRLHRLACGLGGLALTVNAALVAVMISADVAAYQTTRAGLARHQWWLAPLGWPLVAAHPARQVMLGVLVPMLFVLALVWLASKSWRYEAVRPPYQVTANRNEKARRMTAASIPGGLADGEFWDGESSVRLITWVHVAVVTGFLAVVLAVTTKALTASPHVTGLAWAAIGLGAGTVAAGAGYVCLDAAGTPAPDAAAAAPDGSPTTGHALTEKPRGLVAYLLVPGAAAMILAGVFAWLQPGDPAPRAAELPGMAHLTGWTVLAVAAVAVIVLISMLLGLPSGREVLIGGPWVTLMLAAGLLNTLLLGAEIWVAHLVGPVTSNAADALARPLGKIYLPGVITSGIPLLVWATVLAVLVFGLIEGLRWLLARRLPADAARAYRDRAAAFRIPLTGPRKSWYWSGLAPFPPPGDLSGDDGQSRNWEQTIARARFLGRAPHDAAWLLWGIVLAQLAVLLCACRLHVQPPAVIRSLGVVVAGLVLPAMMAFLYAAWNDPAKRRAIGVLWDVGTFWPRSYHPLSPPCYAERAVPELQRRMWWLHDNGGRVVLVAHSQGAVLATAALVQQDCRPPGDRPALITFGSPVGKLYGWGFPAYFGHDLLKPLEPGGAGGLSDWRNVYYPTDPVGGPVAGGLARADGSLVDRDLRDPEECYYIYAQAPPCPQGHSGYWADPRVWNLINQVAADAGRSARNPAEEARASLIWQLGHWSGAPG